jgi:two-component system OmpR family sensor kinase
MPPAATTRTARPGRWRDPAGWPLRTRIVATMIALLAVLGLVVGGTAELYLYKSLHQQIDADLADLEKRIGGPGLNKGRDDQLLSTSLTGRPTGGMTLKSIVVVITAEGDPVGGKVLPDDATSSETGPPGRTYFKPLSPEALATLSNEVHVGEEVDVNLSNDYPEYRMMAKIVNGETLYVGLSLANVNSTLLTVAAFTGCVIAGSLLIAGWGGALIVRRTLQPLDRVAATATRVSELKLDAGEVRLAQRVPEADTDPRTEVGQVGAALNRMLDHVGNALEARHASEMQVRQFVADASHELRTPLAAIRGYAELSRRSRQPVPGRSLMS